MNKLDHHPNSLFPTKDDTSLWRNKKKCSFAHRCLWTSPFHSKKKELTQAKKSFFRGFLLKHRLLFAKEYKIVNSKSYDSLLENKTKIEKNYIVHLDAEMNGRHEIETRGRLDLAHWVKSYGIEYSLDGINYI